MSELADPNVARLIVVDNYDSFTFNIVHALELAGARCDVVPNDRASAEELLARAPDGFVISAGPCTPNEAGVSRALVQALLERDEPMPLLGICLGHQVIARALGGRIIAARHVAHGKHALIRHDGRGLFEGTPSPMLAARYNSLVVDPDSLSRELEASAWDENGELMGLRHKHRPMVGLQFHPESALSEVCRPLFRAWLGVCRAHRQPCAASVARAG
jgi:anthranilate synthase component 2